MKTIAFLAAVLVAASVSGEQATTTDPAVDHRGKSAQKPAPAKPAAAAPAPTVDSPLVKAARRAGAKKSTKKVITNETLKEMNKGRITTTTIKSEVLVAPVSSPEAESEKAYQEEVQRQREADATKAKEVAAKKAEEARRIERLRRAAAAAEDGDAWLDGDPAALEELKRTASEPAKP